MAQRFAEDLILIHAQREAEKCHHRLIPTGEFGSPFKCIVCGEELP
jgi:hypothetical protein